MSASEEFSPQASAVQPIASEFWSDIAVGATPLLAGLATAKLFIQFAGINHYGFFRDELYYMACGEHLAWGYIDQPPLVALVAWIARHAFGNSLFAVRLLPALA